MAGSRKRRPPISPAARKAFLEALSSGASVTRAATIAAVRRERLYELRRSDEVFKAEWEQADAAGLDALRDEIWRRGVEGYRDFRLDKDGVEHELTVYSDRLLELEAKRRDPAYRERSQLELSGAARLELDANLQVEPQHDFDAILEGLVEAGVIAMWLENNPALVVRALELVGESAPPERNALDSGDFVVGDGRS